MGGDVMRREGGLMGREGAKNVSLFTVKEVNN